MVPLKITRIGNSLGVVLPKEAVSHLRVEQGDALYLTEAPDGYRLTAFDPQFEAQMKAARSVMKKRRNVLRELAK
jgi:putative addiction module antidote